MPASSPIDRRSFLGLGAAGLVATLAACTGGSAGTRSPAESVTPSAAAPTSAATTTRPERFAYCPVLKNGEWKGPVDNAGHPNLSIIDDILEQRVGYARPAYLRMTGPSPGNTVVPGPGSVGLAVLQRLKRGGIHLGTAVSASPTKQNTTAHVIETGRQLRAASERGGADYDWIFLDHAHYRTPAGKKGLNDLQQIIDGLIAAGWSNIMINATGFGEQYFSNLPQRTWAMARHLAIMGKREIATVPKVVDAGTGAVTSSDAHFADYVSTYRSDSTAILKLEIPDDVKRFATLSRTNQAALLGLWAQESARHRARIIYPLCVGTLYDSLLTGTFWEQRSLMQRYP